MIDTKDFVYYLQEKGIDFYAGVPDSLLKNFCAFITDNFPEKNHIISANEGGAIGLAAGYHLSTGRIGCVYMQNSGQGNAINPLLSLTDKEVYDIPLLLVIGWRGEPGVKDEPQHVKQGKITLGLLETMGIEYSILDEKWKQQVDTAMDKLSFNRTYALIVRKGVFSDYKLQKMEPNDHVLSREEAIKTVVDNISPQSLVVSTTGMISRELYEYRESKSSGHGHDFLTVGSMGHASQIALGIALQKKERQIFCFDGDGAVIMHMGGMAIIGSLCPDNYTHIVFNNAAHDSVGGQPTVGYKIDLQKIAQGCGYKWVYRAKTRDEIIEALKEASERKGAKFIEILVRRGARKDLSRPGTTPIENKISFIQNIG